MKKKIKPIAAAENKPFPRESSESAALLRIIKICTGLLIGSPLIAWVVSRLDGGADEAKLVEYFLILIGGLTNTVAIVDICRNKRFDEFRFVFVAQLCSITFILAFDCQKLISWDGARMMIAAGVCVTGLSWLMISRHRSDPQKTLAWLLTIIFGMIGVLLVPAFLEWSAPHFIDAVHFIYALSSSDEWLPFSADELLHFAGERFHAWVHLLLIPIIYLVGDKELAPHLPSARNGLSLDKQILWVGLACLFAGLVVKEPRFEAGAAAVVLLLGNWVYSTYVVSNPST